MHASRTKRGILRFAPNLSLVLLGLVVGLMQQAMAPSSVAWGQLGRYPAPDYYLLQSENSVLFNGDFRAAERVVQNLYRGGYREGNQRWIDSTAYLYLQGEIRYQAGDYAAAMQSFDEALEIYSALINWSARVNWESQPITPDPNALRIARITWGQPVREPSVGRFPSSLSTRFGQDIVVQGDRGNTLIPQERIVPVDAIELYRAMALLIRRRDQILGSLSQVDAPARLFRGQLSEARAAVPGILPTTFGSILYGISVSGEGDYQRSNGVLQQCLRINGLDHPLTPVALLQIGTNQYWMGDYRTAKATLLEASYSAGYFNQMDIVREALVMAGRAHMAVNRDQLLPELDLAFEWARLRGMRVAQAQFALVAAENALENGQLPLAKEQLTTALGLLRTAEMRRSELALRLAVLQQTVLAIEGADLQTLRAALVAYRPATPWAFQIEMLVNPARRRNLTTTVLTNLIERVLRDPTQQDWDRDPFECLAYLTGDRSQFLADALTLQINKRDYSNALVAAENLRRVQFLANLPLGGRLLSFRELLARSPAELTPEMRRRQAELLSRFTALKLSLEQAQALLTRLQTQPLAPPDAGLPTWEKDVETLARLSNLVEGQLIHAAVRREALPLLFPPPVDLERIQTQIPDKTLCLVVVFHNNVYHALLVTKDQVVHQAALGQLDVAKAVRALGKAWGHVSASAVLQPQVLLDNSWKKTSHELFKKLIPNGTPEFWDSFEELVVVPAGWLWYLPFETCALAGEVDSPLLIDKVAVRYAPSLNLAFGPQRSKRWQRGVFYPGKIDIRDEDAWADAGQAALQDAWPQLTTLRSSRVPGQWAGPLAQVMIYQNEIRQAIWPAPWTADQRRAPHLQLDVERWVGFPNVGPELLIVAGGSSIFADGMKGSPTGAELEFYSTLLMAAGCQSMVLPRWRSGGHVPYDLTVALTKRLQEHMPSVALREAIQEIRQTPLDPTRQTRVRSGRGEAPPTADHPFFWAGQMLIDRGSWYREPDEVGGVAADPAAGLLQMDDAPPAGGQAPPAENADPPGGQAPPAEGQAPPAEGQAPPAEGQTPPGGGQTPPGGQGPPPIEQAPPGGQEPPGGRDMPQ